MTEHDDQYCISEISGLYNHFSGLINGQRLIVITKNFNDDRDHDYQRHFIINNEGNRCEIWQKDSYGEILGYI